MLKNKKTRQKISTNAVDYAKNIELNGKNENWNRATKAVKKIAVQHVRKVKDKKKYIRIKTPTSNRKMSFYPRKLY